jgi:hypothetical protein
VRTLALVLFLVAVGGTAYCAYARKAPRTMPVTLAFDEHNGLVGDVPVEVIIDDGPSQPLTADCAKTKGPGVVCRVRLSVAQGSREFRVRTRSPRGWSPWSVTTTLIVPKD